MSDTNSFLDALQRRNGLRRDEEDVSLGLTDFAPTSLPQLL